MATTIEYTTPTGFPTTRRIIPVRVKPGAKSAGGTDTWTLVARDADTNKPCEFSMSRIRSWEENDEPGAVANARMARRLRVSGAIWRLTGIVSLLSVIVVCACMGGAFVALCNAAANTLNGLPVALNGGPFVILAGVLALGTAQTALFALFLAQWMSRRIGRRAVRIASRSRKASKTLAILAATQVMTAVALMLGLPALLPPGSAIELHTLAGHYVAVLESALGLFAIAELMSQRFARIEMIHTAPEPQMLLMQM